MRSSRRSVLIGTGGMLLAGIIPASAEAVRVITGGAFGTSWRVTLPPRADEAAAMAAVRSIVRSVDEAMSPFRPESEISQFNASSNRDWQPLSPQTCIVVKESLEIAARSGGAYDPTVGPIVGRYGFGPIRRDSDGLYHDLLVRGDAIRKLRPDLTLDLCGIAKGYAVDRIAAALDGLGIGCFLIEFGGEVFARGQHPSGRTWQVGIERPAGEPAMLQRIVSLGEHALATSGDWITGYVVAGRRYCHIIDPRTREPIDNGIAAVSVIMPTATSADAFATALMAKGLETGAALAEREGIAALFLVRDKNGLREVMTSGFVNRVLA